MANTGQYDSQTNIELEDYEREIFVQPEAAVIYGGSGVSSVNGQTGDVTLTTSDLENTSDYQTGEQVASAIGTAVTAEARARENADNGLQSQIDALTVSSDVIDVLGTYQDLQNYDTSHVKENDIIKVLQDSTHSNAMSYYKWVITSNVGAWVYVVSEGPFYTKSEADVLLNSKQNTEDNSLDTSSKTIVGAINEVDSIAKGANQALSFASYAAMVTEFNSLDDDAYNVGQNIYIQTLEVPDLWISSVESTSTTYTYVDDATFVSGLDTNGYVQVGYYKLSALETQKVDLTNYVTNTDYATSTVAGVMKVSNGVVVGGTGSVSCSPRTYADYSGLGNSYFISKGTLENVITGKGIVDSTKIKTSENTTQGNVYDVTYINSMIGNLETILTTLDVGSGVQ